MSFATTASARPGRGETLTGSRSAEVREVRCRAPERCGPGDAATCADVPEPTRLPSATVVHAAAALHLGLGSRDLRGSVGVLGRAIADALRRTGGHEALTTAAVEQILDVAEEGWSTWQARVEQVIPAREPGGWRADAA